MEYDGALVSTAHNSVMRVKRAAWQLLSLRTCRACLLLLVVVTLLLVMVGWDGSVSVEFESSEQRPSSNVQLQPFTEMPRIRTTPPTDGGVQGRSKHDGKWHQWTKSIWSIYVFTSFYDNRISIGSLPVVRVIGVSNLGSNQSVTCVFWFVNQSEPFYVTGRKEDIGAGVFRHDQLFVEFIVTCPINSEDRFPRFVSLVPSQQDEPSFRCPVEWSRVYPHKEMLAVCVSVTYWNIDPLLIVEWFEVQRMLGVSHVTVYNSSIGSAASKVLQYYHQTEPEFLELRQSDRFRPEADELSYHMQMSPVINDCMYRNLHRFHKLMVIDFDEFVIPRKSWTLLSFLHNSAVSLSKHPAAHFLFRNMYFFSNYPTADTETLVTLKHRTHAPTSEYGYAAKSIIDPRSCALMHNHYCWRPTPLYDSDDLIADVTPVTAALHHYKKCHFEKDKCDALLGTGVKDDTMFKYKRVLSLKVNEKLKAMELL